MRKEHTRDYATEAFRYYARKGGSAKYIDELMEEMRRSLKSAGISNPTEAALMHKERIRREHAAEFADLEAVEIVLTIVDLNIRKAIEFVYFKDCWKDLQKGDIETRVHHAEIMIPASRAQIYRWLSKARWSFAEERGLRV